MKGKYRIIVENKKIRYDFEIKRNITIIKGDSATGKTTLADMIAEYEENGADSGIRLTCDRECHILQGRYWKALLAEMKNSIIFIDEGNKFVSSVEFAEEVKRSDNYFVIITREALETLPYSVDEIYGIRNSGKYGTLKNVYNEMYKIYTNVNVNESVKVDYIITEDSKAGYQFFKEVYSSEHLQCISADGKSNIYKHLKKDKNVLVVADGAAFGSEVEKIELYARQNNNCYLYLPESFEWLILKSGVIKNTDLSAILQNTWDYVDSSMYMSWERYFTALLVELTNNTYLQYSKNDLNDVYIKGSIKDNIVRQIKILSDILQSEENK